MAELLKARETAIASIRLVPSDGGRFEVVVNGDVLFSKLEAGRHPQEGEVLRLLSRRG
jgi:selenoprotein W-related protein